MILSMVFDNVKVVDWKRGWWLLTYLINFKAVMQMYEYEILLLFISYTTLVILLIPSE